MYDACVSGDGGWQSALVALRAGDVSELSRLLRDAPGLLDLATGDVARPAIRGSAQQHAAVDLLLAAGADPNAAASDGWTPLHIAAMAGHVDWAQRLPLAGAAREGRLLGASGGSPLALALFYAEREVAELLAEPPAMHLAAQYGRLKCLRLLLERGADPNIEDAAYDATPLGWAKHVGAHESVELLLQYQHVTRD